MPRPMANNSTGIYLLLENHSIRVLQTEKVIIDIANIAYKMAIQLQHNIINDNTDSHSGENIQQLHLSLKTQH